MACLAASPSPSPHLFPLERLFALVLVPVAHCATSLTGSAPPPRALAFSSRELPLSHGPLSFPFVGKRPSLPRTLSNPHAAGRMNIRVGSWQWDADRLLRGGKRLGTVRPLWLEPDPPVAFPPSPSSQAPQKMAIQQIIVGTHSDKIHLVEFDSSAPSLTVKHSLKLRDQPSWIVLSPTHPGLCYVNGWVDDLFFAVRFDAETGFEVLDQARAGGGGPTHMEVTPDGKALLSVNVCTSILVRCPLRAVLTAACSPPAVPLRLARAHPPSRRRPLRPARADSEPGLLIRLSSRRGDPPASRVGAPSPPHPVRGRLARARPRLGQDLADALGRGPA